mgnify:CR=1 FL=1
MILREKLAELLFKQSWNDVPEASLSYTELSPWLQKRYIEQADEIITLFVNAIKGAEFKAQK